MAATTKPEFKFHLYTPKSSQTANIITEQLRAIFRFAKFLKKKSETNQNTFFVPADTYEAAGAEVYNQLKFIVQEQFGNNYNFVFSMPGCRRDVETLGLTKVATVFPEDDQNLDLSIYFKIHEVKKNRTFQPKLKLLA